MPAGRRGDNAQSYGRWIARGGRGEAREKTGAGGRRRQGTGRRVPAYTTRCSGGEVLTSAAATRPTHLARTRGRGTGNAGGKGRTGGAPHAVRTARRGGLRRQPVRTDTPTPRRDAGIPTVLTTRWATWAGGGVYRHAHGHTVSGGRGGGCGRNTAWCAFGWGSAQSRRDVHPQRALH